MENNKVTRTQVCKEQIHCLSCPLSILKTGKDCEKLSQPEVNKYLEEWRKEDDMDNSIYYY